MILNERHIRRLIKEAINNIMEAEIDPDTGLTLSDDGGAAARDAKADVASQVARDKMFTDVVDFSRTLRLTVRIINYIIRKVGAGDVVDQLDFEDFAKVPGDEDKIKRIDQTILYYLYTLNDEIRTYDSLIDFSRDSKEIVTLRKLAMRISSLASIAERANNPAMIDAYADRLQDFNTTYPVVARSLGAELALDRARSQAPVGLDEGIESDIEAMMSMLVRSNSYLSRFAPNPETLKRAAKVLQAVKDGRTVLSVGSTGPAVEVMQRLIAMHLSKTAGSISRFSRPVGTALNANSFASMAYDAVDRLQEDGFDGKFGENTKDAVEVIQKIMLARQTGTQGVLKKGGTYTYKIENPAAVDGVIGSQTLGVIVSGDFNRKASSIVSSAKDSDRVAGGAERDESQPVDVGAMKEDVLGVFDDVAIESTGDSPAQVAQYRIGMKTILDRGDFEKYRARGLNSRQVATSIMADFKLPDDLVGAPGLVDALAGYIDAI